MTLSSQEFVSANIIRISVSTNTPPGGDSGHGGRTIFKFEDLGGTDWELTELENGFILTLGGDCEADTFIQGLLFAAAELLSQQRRFAQ